MDIQLEKIINSCPKEIDLTNEEHSKIVIKTVDSILKMGISITDIEKIENQFIEKNDSSLIFILLALKIVKSKLLTKKVNQPILISVVFAIYNEHNRIKTKDDHDHGEDFLLKKVHQLEWLCKDNQNIDWELIIVDDGCPENSGIIAQDIIDNYNLNDKVRILHLEKGINKNHEPVKTFNSTRDSQKGGSIVYGMWDAVKKSNSKNQIVIYTDADLSTHLGQVMLLVDPILNQRKLAAIGSRREPNSVVIKQGARNDRGKLFIYLWKRLIPNLGDIIDTQCGFKAFKAEIIPDLIKDLIEKKFAFDIELLLKTSKTEQGSITKVPIAWIDSEAASTTTDLQPYLPMLKSIVKMYEKYFEATPKSDEFASLIKSLDEDSFSNLLENIPKEIVNREPDDFTEYDMIRVSDFVY